MASDNKDPSYPWYPRDHAADEPVQLMSLEAEGAYHRLLDHQWLHGSIPSDLGQLARVCKNVSLREMQKLWPALAPCFVPVASEPGRLRNRRLERVRNERKEHRAKQVEGGKKGAEARWGPSRRDGSADGSPAGLPNGSPTADPSPRNGLASALASASADADASSTPEISGRGRHFRTPAGSAPKGAAPADLTEATPQEIHERRERLKAGIRETLAAGAKP